MKKNYYYYFMLLIAIGFLPACGSDSSNSSKSTQTYSQPAPKTRIDGANYFYQNFDEFKINLGGSYGSHRIKSVSLNGNYMIVKYAYKSGVLRGNVEPNGSYSGTYSTSSTSGDFDLRFNTDGTAYGSWKSTSSFMSFNGSLSIE